MQFKGYLHGWRTLEWWLDNVMGLPPFLRNQFLLVIGMCE